MLFNAVWIVLIGMAALFATLAILFLVIILLNRSIPLKKPKEEAIVGQRKSSSLSLEEEREALALFSALCASLPALKSATGEYVLQLGSNKRELLIKELEAAHGVFQVNGKQLEVWFENGWQTIGEERLRR